MPRWFALFLLAGIEVAAAQSAGSAPRLSVVWILIAMVAIIFVVIAGLAAVLRANSAPTAEEVKALQSGFEGEQLVSYRVCNALLRDAELNEIGGLAIGDIGGAALALIKKMNRGHWVGGRVFLTSHRLIFEPNQLNRALQNGLALLTVNLAEIQNTHERSGMIANLNVRTRKFLLSMRVHDVAGFRKSLELALARRG